MNSEYSKIGLYDHNVNSYLKIKEAFEKGETRVAIVHATGTGKSYNALQYAYDNQDKKIIYVVPANGIVEHLKQIIEENPNLSINDFNHVEFRTYHSFINLSKDEIKELECDILILDEFHHIGAPVWGQRINTLIKTHEDIKILGMTAYTVRNRGTVYERDMIDLEGEELFSDSVVSNYDLCDAMIDGVLPKPIYKSGYVNLDKTAESLEERIKKLNPNSKDYKELYPLLCDFKRRIHEAKGVSDIFKINIKENGKYIYFCPLNSEEGRNDISSIMEEVKVWLSEMGLSQDEYELYASTSEMGEEGKRNRQAFYNDVDLDGEKTNNKLRIMFAINQYNEGIHAPGLDGVIMGRGTKSDIVFFEQLGRGLSVRGRTKKEYDELNKKTLSELIELSREREIKIKDISSKKEIIELLLAPTIIDFANNVGFIKELENNLGNRVKEIQASNSENKRVIHLDNTSFDIDMINEDLFEIIRYMNDRLSMTWMDKYNLAKAYYEYYGNLLVSSNFKTINGYDEDENGVTLGLWISKQRQVYKGNSNGKIDSKQIKLLDSIGMVWDQHAAEWMNKYNLAKVYYEHYGNLLVPSNFKTINGYEENENGIALGMWIGDHRKAYKGKSQRKIDSERIKLLDSIGMVLDAIDTKWMNNYNLAKAYYEYHGNLLIPKSFKTTNGYSEDKNGIALGKWITNQRSAYKGNYKGKIDSEQIKLLESIGMVWDPLTTEWMNNYSLAKAYYEYHGNLLVPTNFKTTNGYEEDENGISLGDWVSKLRQAYKGKSQGKIDSERIKLLESIGMIWFDDKIDNRLQTELINEKNSLVKQKEILNRSYTLLNCYEPDSLPTREEINQDMLDSLNRTLKK